MGIADDPKNSLTGLVAHFLRLIEGPRYRRRGHAGPTGHFANRHPIADAAARGTVTVAIHRRTAGLRET